MSEEKMLSLSDLDAFFAKQPAPAKKSHKAAKPAVTYPKKPELPRFWIPDAVVLWESQWQCSCGCSGPATPELFVRERMGRNATRLRAIRSPGQFALLPRIIEQAEPSHITTCPNCFAGMSEYVEQQLVLPFPEEVEEFKRAVTKSIAETLDFRALFDSISEHQSVPKHERRAARETPNPVGYEFVPCEVEFDTSRDSATSLKSVYEFSVSDSAGPGFPHCTHYYKEH